MTTEVKSFQTSLESSHSASDLPLWKECYDHAFPGSVMVDHRGDGEHQRAGIDRSLIMPNSKQILIDEKIRWQDYGDIALEYISVDTNNTPGWVCKPLRADYIAYAIAPRGICYLLPVIQLQSAWRSNSADWLSVYQVIKAKNRTYNTMSCCVPIDVLFRAIGSMLRVRFTPINPLDTLSVK